MRGARISALLALLLAGGIAGCTSKPTGDLPSADELLKSGATEMRQVKTVHFTIETEGNVDLLSIRRADGQLTREGSAKGTVQLERSGALAEYTFVIVGSTAYLKGPTGGYNEVPLALAAGVYDPSAILDPERGVAKVLTTATDTRTEAREDVNGTSAYRVAVKLDKKTVGVLVPGAGEGVSGHLWIGADRKLLLRATFTIPGTGGAKDATVTVNFLEFDQPVSVSAP